MICLVSLDPCHGSTPQPLHVTYSHLKLQHSSEDCPWRHRLSFSGNTLEFNGPWECL